MGFKKVYNCLREIFPEVDYRILRAVAIENPKDVDAAVNEVLTEVIPSFYGKTTFPSQDPCLEFASKKEVEDKMEMDSLRCEQMPVKAHVGLAESGTIGGEASDDTAQKSDLAHIDAVSKQSVFVNNYVASDDNEQSHDKTETTSLIAPVKIQEEDSSKVGLDNVTLRKSNDLVDEDGGCSNDHKEIHKTAGHMENTSSGCSDDFINHLSRYASSHDYGSLNDLNTTLLQKSYCTESHYDCSFLTAENSDDQIDNPSFENHSLVLPLPEIHLNSESDYQKLNANGTSNPSPKEECYTGELCAIEDGLMGHTIMTQSGQLCSIGLLDETIEDAKSNKITLFSAMESVINKMKELEHKEKDVEKAKEEAANGGSEILAKVEELKQTVAHSKEANDMVEHFLVEHAGEVYGEKAILATETRELQSRLLSLSDERDKSLSILDEMHTTLEARIAAVDAMLRAAEEEKLAKEEHARISLSEQEALMEKVAQESMTLRWEAEENSKLREFLFNRGQIVDTLQGEISVICQDVRQLKDKFDDELPLSKSLSSSQTSCLLASSGSSLKSMTGDTVRFFLPLKDIPSDSAAEKGVSSNTPMEGSRASSVDSSSPKHRGEEGERNDHKAFSDDGWDLFDKDAEFADAIYFVDAKE